MLTLRCWSCPACACCCPCAFFSLSHSLFYERYFLFLLAYALRFAPFTVDLVQSTHSLTHSLTPFHRKANYCFYPPVKTNPVKPTNHPPIHPTALALVYKKRYRGNKKTEHSWTRVRRFGGWMGGGCKIDRSHARPGTPPIGWLAVFGWQHGRSRGKAAVSWVSREWWEG